MSHIKALFTLLHRRFSSTAITNTQNPRKLPPFPNVRSEYKLRVVGEAQKALREYLHETRSLPFLFADQIAANSLVSLSKLLLKIPFSAKTFSKSFKSLLRYEPINEFEFFLESIGVDPEIVPRFLPPRKFFFSEDRAVINSAFALFEFGFPWSKLGNLYVEEVSIFRNSPAVLTERLNTLKDRSGFDKLSVVGVCLAFPHLLNVEGEIFDCLIRVFNEVDDRSCFAGNVEAWHDLCRKVRIFCDLGLEKEVGESICRRKELFFRCPKEVIIGIVNYFAKFGVRNYDVGLLLLRSPEILNLDLDSPVISVSGLLEHFGLSADELQRCYRKYPHVFGRNKMANLPNVVKALDLHEWLFEKIKSSNGELLETYSIFHHEEDREAIDAWKRIESVKLSPLMLSKVEFLSELGFGENACTTKLLNNLHGSAKRLQERFEFFLRIGIKHSEICVMIIRAPHILCQNPEKMEEKVNFLCREMGSSLSFLVEFPRYLHFDLDSRIKRRYRFYVWLREKGLCIKEFSISHMLKSNEKCFVERLLRIHPAAPKHYFER